LDLWEQELVAVVQASSLEGGGGRDPFAQLLLELIPIRRVVKQVLRIQAVVNGFFEVLIAVFVA